MASATIASATPGSAMSPAIPCAVPPDARIMAATRAASVASLSTTSTIAPSRAKRLAMPSPSPSPPPVVIATCPSICPMIQFRYCLSGECHGGLLAADMKVDTWRVMKQRWRDPGAAVDADGLPGDETAIIRAQPEYCARYFTFTIAHVAHRDGACDSLASLGIAQLMFLEDHAVGRWGDAIYGNAVAAPFMRHRAGERFVRTFGTVIVARIGVAVDAP